MKSSMLKADGRPDQLILDGLDCPELYNAADKIARRRELLGRFDRAQRTESSFWLVFNALSENDVAFLSALFLEPDEWSLFVSLCKRYAVFEA